MNSALSEDPEIQRLMAQQELLQNVIFEIKIIITNK